MEKKRYLGKTILKDALKSRKVAGCFNNLKKALIPAL